MAHADRRGHHALNGRTRNYILRVPANYDNSRPYRLVFGFHWNGGTAGDVDSGGTSGYPWSYYGLRSISNDSAIFVAPQGLGNGWANSNGEDLTFVDDMIRQLDAGLCVDTNQRFAGGFSYGGGMSFALACARPTVFRAVAVYAGGQLSGCNGCTPQNPPEPARGSLTHVVTTYSGCRAGYPVAWAAYDAGHTPGPVDGSAGDFEPGERSWTRAVVWNFFTQFDDTAPTPTTFRLRNEGSGRCLDVNGANAANGTPMIVWDCHSNANQQFTQNGARCRCWANACTSRPTPPPARGCRSRTATVAPASSGSSTATARSATVRAGCAWMSTAGAPPTAPRSSRGAATTAPISAGREHRRTSEGGT